MQVHFGGHLAFYQPQRKPWAEIQIPGPMLLEHVIARLGIPRGEIAIAVVNGAAVDPTVSYVSDTDVVQFFPPTNGGSNAG